MCVCVCMYRADEDDLNGRESLNRSKRERGLVLVLRGGAEEG